MSNRTRAREAALKTLYSLDMGGGDIEEIMENIERTMNITGGSREFYETIVHGTEDNISTIDETLDRYSENWSLGRMTAIDRSILRVAVFEMCFLKDAPVKVIINEAVNLAGRFGSDQSGPFINGILDRIARTERL